MSNLYSVEQISSLLDLHPKTVRGFIRDGKLAAHKVGRQYRVHGEDLNRFVGMTAPADSPEYRALTEPPANVPIRLDPHADGSNAKPDAMRVSSVIDLDQLSALEASELTNKLMAIRNGRNPVGAAERGSVNCLYYETEQKLKVVLYGGTQFTIEMIGFLSVVAR